MGGRTIASVTAAALAVVWLGCCGTGCQFLGRKSVNLVKKWGLEEASKVSLTRKPTQQTITLESSTELRQFLRNLKNAVEGGNVELIGVGFGEVQVRGRRACRFGVLLDREHGVSTKMAVQRWTEGPTEPYYYLPKEFVNLWADRLGLPD